MSTIHDALKLIAAKSPGAMLEAAKTMRSSGRILQMRYNWIVQIALGDPQADFTAEDRALIAAHLEPDTDDDIRDYTLRIRLTPTERADLEQRAEAAGQTVSEYVRRTLFGQV